MKVLIKSFDVAMEVKSKGVEFEVRSPDGSAHQGDCFATMTGVIWCKGRTSKQNGVKLTWKEMEEICESKESKKAALKAVRAK